MRSSYWFIPAVRFFRGVRFDGDWELNFIWASLSVRLGRSQCAVWWNYKPIVQWLAVR